MASAPFWTPDSKKIAYPTMRGLFIVAADGEGEPVKIAEGFLPARSPDGRRVAMIVLDKKDRKRRLRVMKLADRTHADYLGDGPGEPRMPGLLSWTADSRRVLLTVTEGEHKTGAWAVDAATGKAERIVPAEVESFNPIASPSGLEVVYQVERTLQEGEPEKGEPRLVRDELWLRGRDGPRRKLMERFPGGVVHSFSPDGRWLAFRADLASGESTLGLLRLSDGALKAVKPEDGAFKLVEPERPQEDKARERA
jgi:hypothetical protein